MARRKPSDLSEVDLESRLSRLVERGEILAAELGQRPRLFEVNLTAAHRTFDRWRNACQAERDARSACRIALFTAFGESHYSKRFVAFLINRERGQ